MKRLILLLALLLVLAAALAGWGLLRYRSFLDHEVTPPGGEVSLEVAPGTSLHALAAQLSEAGVIEDVQVPGAGSLFYLWAHKVENAGARLKAGEYLFSGPAAPPEVLAKITEGQVRTYRVTIPEGLRIDEIMPLFEAAGLARADALLGLARDPGFVRSLGVEADTLEGYVFPDTYTFAKGLAPEKLLERTVRRFEEAYAEADRRRQSGVKLDRHEAVTLASIIEKETGAPSERPLIGCVFHNRLRDGWKLQTDPTVIYAKILRSGWSWTGKNITRKDLETPHPYNTYTRTGLPPGPIASPGAEALAAALDPARCDHYFFVSRNDGTHVFCDTLACHNAAVQKWQIDYHRRRR